MSNLTEEERFFGNVQIMAEIVYDNINFLYSQGYSNISPVLVSLAVNILSSFDKVYLINGFIENSHIFWDSILRRDEIFFIENTATVFKYLPLEKVNLFKDLFTIRDKNGNIIISQEIKDQLWDIFGAMVKICIKYIIRMRKIEEYFFDEIDIKYHKTRWNINVV